MHELAITESILKIAEKHAAQANATKVTDINIVIGQLSSIVNDSVQFYWDIVSKDTLCASATLHFIRVPAKMICLDCSNEFEIPDELTACPQCSSFRLKVAAGEEFWLDSIEIER